MKQPSPVTHLNPVITLKVKKVVVQSSIGKEWFVEITPVGFGIDPIKIRLGKQNTFILQKPWDTKSPSNVVVRINLTEKDKISDIEGPDDYDLEINKSLPIGNDANPDIISGHRNGQKIISIIVKGIGGDGGKTANAQITFEWFLSSNMDDLVSYIHSEMVNNLNTPEFIELKGILDNASKLNSTSNLLIAAILGPNEIIAGLSKVVAYRKFTELVGYNKMWDHKAPIYKTCGEWSLDIERGMYYRYDVFANIHYGYIGRAAGFTKNELLDGAGLAQVLNEKRYEDLLKNISSFRKLDDPIDQEAIGLGIAIWEKYNKAITKDILYKKIRDKKIWKGGRITADEGRKNK